MNYEVASGLIFGFAALAGLASFGLGQRIEVRARRSCHEVGIAVFLQVGVIYAVLVAFVFNEVWTQFNEAEQAVQIECADMMGVAQRSVNLPGNLGQAVLRDVTAYLTSVRDDEWLRMRQRRFSHSTGQLASILFHDVEAIDPNTPAIAASRDRMLALAGDAYNQRQVRIFQLKSNVPTFLWALLTTSGTILTLFVVFSGLEHSLVHAAITGVFAAFLVSILVSIHMLDYPFEGSISISDKTISESIESVIRERPVQPAVRPP